MSDLMARAKSILSGSYTFEREIGRGGMATVFLAMDRKHDRRVAVKVMHPELAAAIGGERFLREISIEAHLQHPHIVPLLDSGEVDGLLYYVMPYVAGESLRHRLTREGALEIPDAVRFWRDVVDAIAHAHRRGILHRDIKPENVLVAERHASVVDFGIGKVVGLRDTQEALTSTGVVVGTPLYMAPEQALADSHIDHRTDIYSLGILAYEMIAGKPPFASLGTAALFAHKATEVPPDVRETRPDTPPELAALVARCIQPDPNNRFQSADDLLAALESATTPGGGTITASFAPSRPRSMRHISIASGVLVLVVGGTALYASGSERRWAESVGVAELRRLSASGPTVATDSAFLIASRVRAALPRNAEVDSLLQSVTSRLALPTRVRGTRVYWTAYRGDTSNWHEVGTTPFDSVPLPAPRLFTILLKFEQPGFRTAVRPLATERGRESLDLDSIALPDSDMVFVRGRSVTVSNTERAAGNVVAIPDFMIGRYEVSNREFKVFVAAGGYERKELWDLPIRDVDGNELSWDAAIARFRDRTGRIGPATWEVGDIPAGKKDFPVAGIRWYEARAFARFVGRELPTIHHWRIAARVGSTTDSWILPVSNVKGTGLARIGSFAGMTAFGAFDMAGNVREWCVNADGNKRYILGGSWQEEPYVFSSTHTEDPLDRSHINGVRLMAFRSDAARQSMAALSVPAPRGFRDYSRERPVGETQFRSFLPLFDYDRTPLNASIVETDCTDNRWILQEVTFNTAYASERVRAFMFLPRNSKPPFQTVLYFPGSGALDNRNIELARSGSSLFDFIVTTGRAVIVPIYKGTYDRNTESVSYASDPVYNTSGALLGPNTYRDHTIMQVKDMRRAVDYLQTRPDVDTSRIAYLGYSWGGRLAPINLVVEPRFKVAVLALPGLKFAPRRPEVDEFNYLPRVKTPTLIMSGRYDNEFPYDVAALPFIRELGVAQADLRQRVYPSLHFLPRDEMIRETLDWLDKYLGRVSQ